MNNTKTTFIWNMLGSLANALSSMLLLMIAGRTLGDYSAGVFSISLAIAQLVATIGLFEVRTYQASDINEEFDFSHYFTLRLITCAFMLGFSLLYISIMGYQGAELFIIVLMILYKGADAFIDVYHGLFQQKNRLDLAGKSLFGRTTLCTLAFIFGVILFDELMLPMIMMNIISLLWMMIFDLRWGKKYTHKLLCFNKSQIYQLFLDCLPLCICSFLSIYLINSPKYAIDIYVSNEIQGVFSYIFMPTAVINLFSIFLLRPLTTSLSIFWNEKRGYEFKRMVLIVVSWIGLLTLSAVIGGYFLGVPVLSWFYATNLTAYKNELLIILLGGGFSALGTALYYILTVMRCQKKVLLSYLFVFAITLFIVPMFTQEMGILGASLGYMIVMALLSLGLVFVIIKNIKRK